MLAIQLTQDGNLLLNIINLIFCIFKIDNLDSHWFASDFREAFVDLAKSRERCSQSRFL